MTSLLSAKKRAEEFAAVVDGGADESTLRPELRELVGLVGTLQREAQVGAQHAPRADFTATLRERLMAEAATSLASDNLLKLPARTKGTRERRVALVASSLVFLGGTAGMAAAAQNALPGEALYPIKRGLEKAQTGLATSRAAKGEDLLAQADSRLLEVRGLFDSSTNLSQVPSTIDAFTRQALEASDVLIQEYESSGDDTLIEELRTFAADNLDELQELSKNAQPKHQDELAVAAGVLMQIDSRAREICPSCAAQLGSLERPTILLAANEARLAMDAAGRVVVDNTHPVVTGAVPTEPRGDGQRKAPAGDGQAQQTPPSEGATDTDPTVPTEDTDGTDPGDTAGGDGTPSTGGEPDLPELPEVGADTGANGGGSLGGGLLGGGKDSSGTKNDDKGTQDEGAKVDLPKELDGAVGTLLP